VLTRHGYVPIAEVYRRAKEQGEVVLLTEGVEKDGDPRGFAVEVLVPHVALTVDGKTKVEYSVVKSGVIMVGTKDVYRVVTKEGFEIKATPDHRLLVIKGTRDRPTSYEWKRVDELKPGDLLVVAPMEAPEDVGEDTCLSA
jgi:ribonucleoside-diphosphate reductase alpha chain